MYKTKELTYFIISFLILTTISGFLFVEPVKSSEGTIWVDDDFLYAEESDGSLEKPYKFIQAAIDVAKDGDRIKILPGVYSEDLVIDKAVTLVNDDRETTIIRSNSKTKYIIDITADSVSLEGFTITDYAGSAHRNAVIHIASGATEIRIIDNMINRSSIGYGLYIEGSGVNGEDHKAVINNNTFNNTKGLKLIKSNLNIIYDNYIENGFEYGIYLESSKSNVIEKNIIRNNSNHGIYGNGLIDSTIKNNSIFWNYHSGITLYSGGYNIIENNKIEKNAVNGLVISSSNDIIANNTFEDNNIGILLSTNNDNAIIKNNTFYLCNSYGILARTGSNSNIIYNNTFPDPKPIQYHAKEEGNNNWDDGNIIGNYWSDYYGPDNNDDNVGDIPYTIGGVSDNYPKGVFQQPPIISNPSPEHLSSGVTKDPVFQVEVEDPEGGRLDVYFYYIVEEKNENISVQINSEPINIASGETASVKIDTSYSYIGVGYGRLFLWYVVAYDQYSNTSSLDQEGMEWIFSTVETPIDNVPPISNAGGPYEIQLGDELHFNGSNSYDTDGIIEFYRWAFGDGSTSLNIKSPSHIYKNIPSEPFNVSLVVIDNYGSSSIDTTTVTVLSQENDPPVANAGGPYSGKVEKPISFDGSNSYDTDEVDALNYTWSFGDGQTSNESNPIHVYTSAAKYSVTLTVTDSSGLSNSDTIEVTIKKTDSNDGIGFELFFVLIAIALILIAKKKNKK